MRNLMIMKSVSSFATLKRDRDRRGRLVSESQFVWPRTDQIRFFLSLKGKTRQQLYRLVLNKKKTFLTQLGLKTISNSYWQYTAFTQLEFRFNSSCLDSCNRDLIANTKQGPSQAVKANSLKENESPKRQCQFKESWHS